LKIEANLILHFSSGVVKYSEFSLNEKHFGIILIGNTK
jgi:hypothetical protein